MGKQGIEQGMQTGLEKDSLDEFCFEESLESLFWSLAKGLVEDVAEGLVGRLTEDLSICFAWGIREGFSGCLVGFFVGCLIIGFAKGFAGVLERVFAAILVGSFLEEDSKPASVGDFVESLQWCSQ